LVQAAVLTTPHFAGGSVHPPQLSRHPKYTEHEPVIAAAAVSSMDAQTIFPCASNPVRNSPAGHVPAIGPPLLELLEVLVLPCELLLVLLAVLPPPLPEVLDEVLALLEPPWPVLPPPAPISVPWAQPRNNASGAAIAAPKRSRRAGEGRCERITMTSYPFRAAPENKTVSSVMRDVPRSATAPRLCMLSRCRPPRAPFAVVRAMRSWSGAAAGRPGWSAAGRRPRPRRR
jgi:hypothetical protein